MKSHETRRLTGHCEAPIFFVSRLALGTPGKLFPRASFSKVLLLVVRAKVLEGGFGYESEDLLYGNGLGFDRDRSAGAGRPAFRQ
jgi:hypothetical protein